VYFKHEEQGLGPDFARRLMEYLGIPRPATAQTTNGDHPKTSQEKERKGE